MEKDENDMFYLLMFSIFIITMSKNKDNDKKGFCVKDAKYKDEQDVIFKKIQKKIKYDDDTKSFYVDDIDRDFIINDIFPDIKKYYHYDIWGRIDIEKENSHISIVKKMFLHRGLALVLKTVAVIDDNNEKVKRKKYFII